MKVVRLSAPRNGRLYTPGNITGTHLCQSLSRPQGHIAAPRFMSKIPMMPSAVEPGTLHPVCSVVSQPPAIAYTCLFILHSVLILEIQDQILPKFPARRAMSIAPPIHGRYLHIRLSYCLVHLVECLPNTLFSKLHCFTVHFHSLSLLVPANALF
jgi:hypothetical protein